MKVYLDLLFFLNLYIDFLILLTTSLTLKRNTSLKRLLLSSLGGSFSLIFLFFEVNDIVLFFLKFIIALFMNIIAFHYKNLKYTINNIAYFYMISTILGGCMYYIKLEVEIIWLYYLLLLLIAPVLLIIYYKQSKLMKAKYNLTYKVTIVLKNKKKLELTGFLDTGNKLVDPITNKPIILIQNGIINEQEEKCFYIPFHSLNNNNLLTCFKPLSVEIEKKQYKNYLLAISDKKFNMDGVECILNNRLMEDLK